MIKENIKEKNSPILAVDLDGVCGDYVEAIRLSFSKRNNIPLEKLSKDVQWNFEEWGITREEAVEFQKTATKEDKIFENMNMINGANEAIKKLRDSGIWIRIVTHRLLFNRPSSFILQETARWLEKNRIIYDEICFLASKEEVFADLYIDDSPSVIEALQKENRDFIIFDRKCNKDIKGPRANNWNEVFEMVTEFFNEHEPKPTAIIENIY